MNDFDELLNEVLRRDVNPQPPSGLKKRIIAGLPVENKHSPDRRRAWVGVAAAIMVGLAMWTLARMRIAFPVVAPSEKVSLTRPDNSPEPIESHEAELLKLDQKPGARRLTPHLRIAVHPHSVSQQSAIRIAPLEIGPIVVQSIEIASIAPGGSTRRGKIR